MVIGMALSSLLTFMFAEQQLYWAVIALSFVFLMVCVIPFVHYRNLCKQQQEYCDEWVRLVKELKE